MAFKSGFVNIIGKPNAGKSTLMNFLVGERLSIITAKAQTTRRRIIGIVNTEEMQIIYSDTPGIVHDPQYKLHERMNAQIYTALEDADVLIYLATPDEEIETENIFLLSFKNISIPFIIALNKIDKIEENILAETINIWQSTFPNAKVLGISVLKNKNLESLQTIIIENIPDHPAYYDTDALTDLSERFFVAEIIREKILEQYEKEIPYSVEVIVTAFKEKPEITVISAEIYVIRETQKIIIIGKGGSAIKKVGTESRKAIEEFIQKKVFLELHVKIKGDWKNDDRMLKHFGYE